MTLTEGIGFLHYQLIKDLEDLLRLVLQFSSLCSVGGFIWLLMERHHERVDRHRIKDIRNNVLDLLKDHIEIEKITKHIYSVGIESRVIKTVYKEMFLPDDIHWYEVNHDKFYTLYARILVSELCISI